MTAQKLTMSIGGKPAEASAVIEVRNPATGKVFASVPDAGGVELDAAVAAAQDAFSSWRQRSWAERAMVVSRIGETIAQNATELAVLLTREQGKPSDQAMTEIMTAAHWLRSTATLTLPVRETEMAPGRKHVTRYVPIGVVAAISPWNFPVALSAFKIAPALLAGNTMVLKPSPYTPMTVLRIGELMRDIVPPGVFNIITGGDALGPLMTAHPGFDKVSFTGSTATGKRVMAAAASSLKRLTLELGGNDAAIVMPDVSVEEIAQKVFRSAFANSGQICIATKRAYVHDAIYDEFRDALARLVVSAKVGDGSEPGTTHGPIQNRPQFDRVSGLVADCEANGFAMIRGEAPEGEGYFLPLTLVDNPPQESRIVQEEQFGPILPLIRFSDTDEVIARVNDSDMGLAGTIWSRDIGAALKLAERMETGNVWINEALALSPFAAFAGHKQSGLGVENGIEGLMAYTEPKTYFVGG